MLLPPALLLALPAAAQRLSVRMVGGITLNGVTYDKTDKIRHGTAFAPRLSAGLHIPLTKRVAILTGGDFTYKGYHTVTSYTEPDRVSEFIENAATRYTQVQLPLQVSVCVLQKSAVRLEAAAGLSYGFMLKARTYRDGKLYRDGQLINSYEKEQVHSIALLPRDNRFGTAASSKPDELKRFNPAACASLTLCLGPRLLIQAHGEYNLYDTRNYTRGGSAHLYSMTLGFGIRL